MELYKEASQQFKDNNTLFHFTNYEVLKKIFSTKKLRLTKIESKILNDQTEKAHVNLIWRGKIFIISFTNEIKQYFWKNYCLSKKEGIAIKIKTKDLLEKENLFFDEQDVMLEECKNGNAEHISYDKTSDWGIRMVDYLKVIYDNPIDYKKWNYEMFEFYGGCLNIDKEELLSAASSNIAQGYIKDKTKWIYENEYRIRLAVRPKGVEQFFKNLTKVQPEFPSNYLYMDISRFIDQLSIVITNEFEHKFELMELCSRYNVKIEEIL